MQSKQHMAYLGVVNRRGQAKAQFVAFMALVKHFEVKFRQLFAIFDIVIVLST